MLYRKPDYVRSRFNIFLPDGESGICPPIQIGSQTLPTKKDGVTTGLGMKPETCAVAEP